MAVAWGPFRPTFMGLSRRIFLSGAALLLGWGLAWAPSLLAGADAEVRTHERDATLARALADEFDRKGEDAGGEVSALIHQAVETLRAFADTNTELAKRIRSDASAEDLDELKREAAEHWQKWRGFRFRLKQKGIVSMGGESGGGGFRPRAPGEASSGVVVLGSIEGIRNWLNEEETREAAK